MRYGLRPFDHVTRFIRCLILCALAFGQTGPTSAKRVLDQAYSDSSPALRSSD